MKKWLLSFLLVASAPLFSSPLPTPRNEEEGLFVRRIIDFWRDHEYELVKTELDRYLHNSPNTPFADHFNAMLGDIALHEKLYSNAVEYYNLVKDRHLYDSVKTKRWQALYHQKLYAMLYDEIALTASKESDEGRFYFAEAAFREARLLGHDPEATPLFKEALDVYRSLLENSTFAPHAKLAMAEIYRSLEQFDEAATLYLELVQEKVDATILMRAALFLAISNPTKALPIFEKLAREKHPEATYQWLQLLAREQQWNQIHQERELFLETLKKDPLASAFFYLGMIAYDRKDYAGAAHDLKKSIETGLASPNDRTALLALLYSSQEIGNLDLCEDVYQSLKSRYPDEKEEAALLRAAAYTKAGKEEKALSLFDEIIQAGIGEIAKEKAFSAKVHLLVECKRLQEAHEATLCFLNLFPQAQKRAKMVRLAVDLSLSLVAEKPLYGQLATDLERGLSEGVFLEEEGVQKRELLAKAYLKLNRPDQALSVLNAMDNPDPFLVAHGYIKKGGYPEQVIYYGEEALRQNPGQERLHLHLFNAYLELAKINEEESWDELAANHLAAVIDTYPISLENRLWLSHYFAKQDDQRAIPLIESLLQTDVNWKRFDQEALELASFYQKQYDFQKALLILQKVIAQELPTRWKAKLAIAGIFIQLGEKEKAISLYQELETSSEPLIMQTAHLNLARLQFEEAPEKSLKMLEELKRRKSLATEPIHLEAALDHADFRASLEPPGTKNPLLFQLLLEVRQEFTIQDNIWAKDYHAAKQLMPEKEIIYQAYMRYLDARLFLLQAEEAKRRGDVEEWKAKEQAAHALFSTLLKGKFAVSSYLVEKASKAMYE